MRRILIAVAGLSALSAPLAASAQDVVVMRRVVAPPKFTYAWKTADGSCSADGQRAVTATCSRNGVSIVADAMCTTAKPTTRSDAACAVGPVVNGDFENDLSGWSSAGMVVEVRNGSKATVLYSPDNYSGAYVSQNIDVTAGSRLTLSYVTALVPGKFTGEMQPIVRNAANGNNIAFNTVQITSTTPTTISLPFTVPAGVTKLNIYLIGWAAGERNAGKPTGFWMDDVKVK